MATSFDSIYSLNLAIMTDSKLSSLADNLYYYALFDYLSFGIAQFRKYCYQDLDDRTDFSQEVYEFTGDGLSGDFVLTTTPPVGYSFYVSVDSTETTNYTYNSVTETVTISPIPADEAAVYIGAYVIGSFTATLNMDEKRILAEGMTIPFQEYNINLTKQLNQMIYGSPVGLHSQANHNKVNLAISEFQYKKIKRLIIDYTYMNDSDDLANLAGQDT